MNQAGWYVTPFFCVLMVEEFIVEKCNMYLGFKVKKSRLSVSHLFICWWYFVPWKSNCHKKFTLKVIIQSFELALRLNVNFTKTCVISVNVGGDFLKVIDWLLRCRVGTKLFISLGLSVGENHLLRCTWKLLIKMISRKIASQVIGFLVWVVVSCSLIV